jgi:hypothetical protein
VTRVTARYKPNHKEMAKLMMSDQMRQPTIDAAEDMVVMLAATVHRSSGAGPHLADSYKVNRDAPPVVVNGSPRAGAEVYSEHKGAAPDEFGGKRQPAKHWLANVAAHWHVPRKGGTE